MLNETIERYLIKFAAVPKTRGYSETLKLFEEMKAEFRSHPPEPSEVMKYLDAIAVGAPLPGSDLAFTAAWSNISATFQGILCRILESEHASDFHESAVELLAQIGDARAIPALKKALGYRWDYDPWLFVPRKSLRALHAIGDQKAIMLIQEAATSSEPLIREEAKSLIENIKEKDLNA